MLVPPARLSFHLPSPSSPFRRPLPSLSSIPQPNPMRDPMRAVRLKALGYVGWRFRPLPPPSSLLRRPPPSYLLRLRAKPYARPLCAPYARPPMRGPRISMGLDRAPCFGIRPQNGALCATPMRALCATPMRGPRISMELHRAPCFETSSERVNYS